MRLRDLKIVNPITSDSTEVFGNQIPLLKHFFVFHIITSRILFYNFSMEIYICVRKRVRGSKLKQI